MNSRKRNKIDLHINILWPIIFTGLLKMESLKLPLSPKHSSLTDCTTTYLHNISLKYADTTKLIGLISDGEKAAHSNRKFDRMG